MAAAGRGISEIADTLTAEKILIPSAYQEKSDQVTSRHHNYHDPFRWNNNTVSTILDRQEYLGHTVLGKTICENFKTKKRRKARPDELMFFPDTHEAIISQEVWDQAQRLRERKPRKLSTGKMTHRLSGLIFCGDCGSRMSFLNPETSGRAKDYTVTRGKNITFSHPRQKRNIRMRSLPEEYREDVIREVLAGRRIHNPRKRRSPLAEQKAQLVSALEAKQNQGRGHYYDLSIQNQITKQQAKALLYYQQHGFTSADDFEAFAESVEAVKQRRDALSAQITTAEKRLNEIAVLQKHITNYLKTKDVYAGYRASGYSKGYYEEHEDAIRLCKASKRAFDELIPSDTSGKTAGSHKKQLPSLKALRAEYAELLAMKKAAYPEYYKAKDEYRELLTYQANLAGLFGIENVRSVPQREHQQEEK